MDRVAQDRASARSDEPEARSDARWRARPVEGAPTAGEAGTSSSDANAAVAARLPALVTCPRALEWLVLQADLERSPRTVDAYARGLADYLGFCARAGVEVPGASRADIARYVRDLRERPGRRGAKVVAIDSGAGLANATLRLRLAAVRLFYDYLVEERVCDRNPVGRGLYASAHSGRRGELHQIATFAGHQSTHTTMRYIHLSGRDLADKLQNGMAEIHSERVAQISEALT